ncbi:MAG: NAD+ synthase [Ignavibacteria bacterium]|nr:NAD+ synthase [Ignavibacteria bacterium]
MNKRLPIKNLTLNYSRVEQTLTTFIRNEITKAKCTNAVFGLSGGIDSAVTAFLTTKSIGKENVCALLMPYETSNKQHIDDATNIAHKLNIPYQLLDISPMVNEFIALEPKMNVVRKGNIMARCRMIALYDTSAKHNALVIGTSNKTEILLGYGTIYGDSACGINPLGDLYKTQIWELAKHLGVPQKIINKVPTADLWQGQTDEGELGFMYHSVDLLLYYLIDKKKTLRELMQLGFTSSFIHTVKEKILRNKFKSRMPRIKKISHLQ